MHNLINQLSPGATTMIRMDHMHVLATFHQYRVDTPPDKKRALAETICLALEIHAHLEQEIFYPAMRDTDRELVGRSIHEHNETQRLIARLRDVEPEDPAFEAALMELMRDVLRHVADEETKLLPDAEHVLGERRLSELGTQMTRRRFQLAAPSAGELAVNTVRSFPAATLAISGVMVLGAFLAGWSLTAPTRLRALGE